MPAGGKDCLQKTGAPQQHLAAPAVWALKSSATSRLVSGSRFVLSRTKRGFCERLPAPTSLVIFAKCIAQAVWDPKHDTDVGFSQERGETIFQELVFWHYVIG